LITRTDDAPETVAARLENQLGALETVVALYRDSGRLGVVSGSGGIDDGDSHG
jgi:adenylate kinase family enzyme